MATCHISPFPTSLFKQGGDVLGVIVLCGASWSAAVSRWTPPAPASHLARPLATANVQMSPVAIEYGNLKG